MRGLSSPFDRYSLVKQIPIFQKLGWLELKQIAGKTEVLEYSKGETIYSQGDEPDAFYCLISGRIKTFVTDDDGSQQDVEFIRRGMYFGIISLLTGEKHSLSFQAINDSVVIRIGKDDFKQLLESIPKLGVSLSQTLSRRLRRRALHAKSIFESTIISVYSPVAGSGSSTYAVNLSLSLQKETQKKVVLVHIASMNEKEHVLSGDSKENTPQAKWNFDAVWLKDIVDDDKKINAAITKEELSIDLLNVQFDPGDASFVDKISQFVTALVDDYHYVIVDLPNEMDDVVLKTLTQSDLVQLVSLERLEDLRMTRQVVCRLEETLKEHFKEERLQVIIRDYKEGKALSFAEVNKEIDYDIYARLPDIDASRLTKKIKTTPLSILLPGEETDYAKIVRKTARETGNVLVGLALGGGAALGLTHIGILRVFEKEKIPIDIVAGSSMGALIAGLWAVGKNADEIERIACYFKKKMNILKLIDPVIPISGLIAGRAIKRWLRGQFGDEIFYNTKIPLKIVAYDILRREEIVINSGLIVDAIQKSIAIPGVVNPIRESGKVIIDGGVLNPLPTNVLVSHGIKKIIAVNVLQSPEDVVAGRLQVEEELKRKREIRFLKSPLQYLKFRIYNMFRHRFFPTISDIIVNSLQASEYILAEQSAQYADIVIHPDLVGLNWYELYRIDDLVKRGEASALELLPQIKQLVKE